MANLTITVPDDILRRARVRALEQGTSVNGILREYLEAFTGARSEVRQALDLLLELSRASTSRRGRRRWTRDELHER